MAPHVSPPLKRLTRPDHPPPFRVTERDVAVLRLVARFRFLSSEQIVRAIGGSPHNMLGRLKLLFWHRLLDRPQHQHVQLAAFFDEGNPALVYGLGLHGARLLAELGASVDGRLDWTTKNARVTTPFLAHTLEVAEVMLGIDAACRTEARVRLVDHHELLPLLPEATRTARDPFRCRVSVREPGVREPVVIGVVPDRLFSLAYPDATRHNFAVELDRATMDVRAATLKGKSSFRRKLVGYAEAWRQRRHTKVWGFQSFRVLTVTPSATRIAHMQAAQHEVTDGAAPGLFLYATPGDLAAHGPLGPAWVSGSGERVALLGS